MEKKLMQNINTLKDLAQEQNSNREEETNQLKIKSEKTKSDTQKRKALEKIEALELLKDKVVFDNYKAICDALSLPVLGGKSKILQLKELHRIFEEANFTEEELTLLTETKVIKKTAIVIDKIFDEPIEKVDGRKNNTSHNFSYGDGIQNIVASEYYTNFKSKGEVEMDLSPTEFNSLVGFTNQLFETEAERLRREYLVRKPKASDLTEKQIQNSIESVYRMISDKLFLEVYNRILTNKSFERKGFIATNKVKIVYKQYFKDGDLWGSMVLDDTGFYDAFENHKKEFARKNNIKEFRDDVLCDSYSMRFATKSEHDSCMNELLDKVYFEEPSLNIRLTVGDYLLSQIKNKNISSSVPVEIMKLKRVISIKANPEILDTLDEETLDSLIGKFSLTREEMVDTKVALVNSIKEKFAKRQAFRKEDRVITKKMSVGKQERILKKQSQTQQTFELNLMFAVLDKIQTV